jgi:hypothetical protein
MGAPTTKFAQFSSSGANPVGHRHQTTFSSYIKELNTASSGLLDYGTVNINSSAYSPTKAVLFRIFAMNGATNVSNMRFWGATLPNTQGFVTYCFKSIAPYISGIALTTASGLLPTSLPASQNVYRTDGFTALSGVTDNQVTEWIYLNFFADSNGNTGKFGGDNSFTYRMTYDYM